MRVARWLIALLLSVAVLGCSAVLPGERPKLGISNGTDLDVVLLVNGQQVALVAPGAPTDIDERMLPPLPWTVEARSVSGRLLTSMDVAPGQVFSTTLPDGATHHSGAMGRIDLSCGRLTIWAGDIQPSGPAPGPNAGAPGDCVP